MNEVLFKLDVFKIKLFILVNSVKNYKVSEFYLS